MTFFEKLMVVLSLLIIETSCTTNDRYSEDFNQDFDAINQEQMDLITLKNRIKAMGKDAYVSCIEQSEDKYTVHFSNDKELTLAKHDTPLLSVDCNSCWTINGEMTKLLANDTPIRKITIGENSNWWIDNKDSGCLAETSKSSVAVILPPTAEKVIFSFSDGTQFNVNKCGKAYFKNNPLPLNDDTLRVLCIGNSYTLDAIAYLHELTKSSGIDLKRVVVYVAIGASTTLEYWYNKYTSGVQIKLSRAAGDLRMQTEGTMKELLAQDWDVITLQQKCSESIHYETFNPYLHNLIDIIRQDCPNKKLAFAWQMVWAYWPGHGGAPYGVERYNAICDAIKKQIQHDGIDIIIPIGTAIENARATDLQTEHCITRDGAHLMHGVGRYIAACTWFQSILAPVFKTRVVGNPLLYELNENDLNHTMYEAAPVTVYNRTKCQQCAYYACENLFEITPIDKITGIDTPTVD